MIPQPKDGPKRYRKNSGQIGRIPIMVYIVKGNVLPPPPVEADGEALPPAILSPIKGYQLQAQQHGRRLKMGLIQGVKD